VYISQEFAFDNKNNQCKIFDFFKQSEIA